MRPARQLVRLTVADAMTGFPAILVRLMTRLGYRWYPEYYVYEEYNEFNQEQYSAIAHIWSREDRSIRELHTFQGIGVTVEMAVQDAAYDALTRLRSLNRCLDDSEFRYIPYPADASEPARYTAVCTPYIRRRYDSQVLIQSNETLDRAYRAVCIELFATRARLRDAMTQLLPAVSAGIHPEYILYPLRTVMPPGVDWPDAGGQTPARGPALPVSMQVLHQSRHGMQDPAIEGTHRRHVQMPGYLSCPRR